MRILCPEQTNSRGTTDRDGRKEVVVVYSFVDEVFVYEREVPALREGALVLIVRY